MIKFLRAAGVGAALALLASCAAPSTEPATLSGQNAEILEIIKTRAPAYPEVTLTDLAPSRIDGSVCGLIRVPGKRPHVIRAERDDGRLRVGTPFLFEPGSWDDPNNRGLSDSRADLCASFGSELPAY